jgi:LmbE family N-acetylglucosaminyl deacetylase
MNLFQLSLPPSRLKRTLFSSGIALLVLILSASRLLAGVMVPFDTFTKDDRILVLAPHPDDETIGTGGVIQEAIRAGADVRVVLFTNGENNELAFIVYKKRPILLGKDVLSMGEVRHKETLVAMNVLGLSSEKVIALGYPDYGTMEIMTKYWGVGTKKPFRGMLSRVRYVPFKDTLSPKAPYIGESILSDLKQIILDFQPTKIFVSHPADVNRDHRALYLFLRVALWDIQELIKPPQVYPYIIHVIGWPKPRGFYPEKVLSVPTDLVKSEIVWNSLALDELAIGKKYLAVKQYFSQNEYAPKYLPTFVRRNEIFGDYPDVPLIKQMASEVAWQYIGSIENGFPAEAKAGRSNRISSLAYARQGNNLLVKLVLKHSIDEKMGVSIFLLGYHPDIPFGEMPKLNLLVGMDGFHVKDRRKNIHSKEILFLPKDKELVFVVPLYLLGNPDRILSVAKTSLYDLTLDETAWRVLLLD